jgi:hypothetical protein
VLLARGQPDVRWQWAGSAENLFTARPPPIRS